MSEPTRLYGVIDLRGEQHKWRIVYGQRPKFGDRYFEQYQEPTWKGWDENFVPAIHAYLLNTATNQKSDFWIDVDPKTFRFKTQHVAGLISQSIETAPAT